MAPVTLTREEARRFARRALLLDEPAADVGVALTRLGYVQIDPVNICGRMHDLILRNRVIGYREGGLMQFLHGADGALAPAARPGFEHHLPATGILVAFPTTAWPYLLAAMRARSREAGRWSGRLTPREREMATVILRELTQRGPLSSEDLNDGRRGRRMWGAATLAKVTLQKLFFHGRVLIARRDGTGNRRLYDLPERVLPAAVLAQPDPGDAEVARWGVLTKLRQRRLALLTRRELPLVEDAVLPVVVEGCPLLHCLAEDAAVLEQARSTPAAPDLRLLAPLDPLIYDRRVTRTLWEFDYVWEAYTPAHKRVRAHYALPVLAGTELVGDVEPKPNRRSGRLVLASKRVRRGQRVSAAVWELAGFLRLKR
jgi:uncharacterized protein YcaQ